jgi:hypothetical protein
LVSKILNIIAQQPELSFEIVAFHDAISAISDRSFEQVAVLIPSFKADLSLHSHAKHLCDAESNKELDYQVHLISSLISISFR